VGFGVTFTIWMLEIKLCIQFNHLVVYKIAQVGFGVTFTIWILEIKLCIQFNHLVVYKIAQVGFGVTFTIWILEIKLCIQFKSLFVIPSYSREVTPRVARSCVSSWNMPPREESPRPFIKLGPSSFRNCYYKAVKSNSRSSLMRTRAIQREQTTLVRFRPSSGAEGVAVAPRWLHGQLTCLLWVNRANIIRP
jgi:hypothetical protein